MHYLMKQLVIERLSEEASFNNFKELLLRHSVQRPPHSLAIFNLDDVKKIDAFVLDSFYRHYEMYKYALTVQDNLVLKTNELYSHSDPKNTDLAEGKLIPAREIEDLR